MKEIEFNIQPMPKPRMTQRKGYWAFPRYQSWVEEINILAKAKKFKLPESYEVIFYMPMAKSWSDKKRKKMKWQPHQQRPDLDNLIKAVNDAFKSEDCRIYEIKAKKIWSVRPSIVIRYK
jgi:Holliday junction resolvase RusA-like endonuclease